MVPISAHALSPGRWSPRPDSVLAVEVLPQTRRRGAVVRRAPQVELPPGPGWRCAAGPVPVRLARLHHAPFTDRLVAKFALPVTGWRGAAH